MTERACLLEPPCDCWTTTVSPVFAFQYLAKATLKSWKSSRVGSYDTFSSLTSLAPAHPEMVSAKAHKKAAPRACRYPCPTLSVWPDVVIECIVTLLSLPPCGGGHAMKNGLQRLKRQPDAGQQRFLVGTVAGFRAAIELRPLVIDGPSYVLAEIPVDADAGGPRLASSCQRIGEGI